MIFVSRFYINTAVQWNSRGVTGVAQLSWSNAEVNDLWVGHDVISAALCSVQLIDAYRRRSLSQSLTTVSVSITLILAIFTDILPVGPWFAGSRTSPFLNILLELRMMEMVMKTGAIRHVKRHHRQMC